jgi:hypothetical protein
MEHNSAGPLAWVESPLQLIAAAEWAVTRDESIAVAFRLSGPQMSTTAKELLARGARFDSCVPYFGIPWQLLSKHREWAVGDAFSGQFRLAGTLRPPRALTLLDDGTMTVAIVDSLLGRREFARPRQRESRILSTLGNVVRDRMLGLAARERLEISTAFALGDERMSALAGHGIRVTPQRFGWVKSTARPIRVPGNRVLLGSAWVMDGRISSADYLSWVAGEARGARLAYLPHRRETREQLAQIAKLPGVKIFETGLPVELVLAGAQEPLEIVTLPTSAQYTLGHLLDGTGSTIRPRALAHESL